MFKAFMALVVVVGLGSSVYAKEGHGQQVEGQKYSPYTVEHSKANPPAKPVISEPAALAVVNQTTVVLKWQPVETATNYHIQVATDPAFKWWVQNDYFYKGTSFELKGLEKGTHYYWRVAAVNDTNDPTYRKGAWARSSFETTK